jgi:hypothetical protein
MVHFPSVVLSSSGRGSEKNKPQTTPTVTAPIIGDTATHIPSAIASNIIASKKKNYLSS